MEELAIGEEKARCRRVESGEEHGGGTEPSSQMGFETRSRWRQR